MSSESLDAWFARADDILTDWRGSTDAMVGHAPTDDAETDTLPAVDSYYEQPPVVFADADVVLAMWLGFAETARRAAERLAERLAPVLTALDAAFRDVGLAKPEPPDGRRERALWLRQNRGSGPADPFRLDGRRHQ